MQIRLKPLVVVFGIATAVGVFSAPACVTTQEVDVDATERLRTAPPGSILTGAPLGLGEPIVVNRRDFIYALAFDPSTTQLAFVHHVSTEMELTVTGIAPLSPLFQEKLNKSEFDNEDVVFMGDRVVVPSRQGVLRALNRTNGALIAEVTLGEALLRVAVGKAHVFVGSADGRVLIFDHALSFIGEARAHKDEVRGLAVLPDGRVLSAGADGSMKVHTVVAATRPVARMPASPLASGDQVFLTHLDGKHAVATIRDVRQASTVISRSAVKRLSLSPPAEGGELTIITAEGPRSLPAIALGELRLRTLSAGDVVAAVCDDCVPAGAELVLGQDVLGRVTLVEDVAAGEIVARPPDPVASSDAPVPAPAPSTAETTAETTTTTPPTTTATPATMAAAPAALVKGAVTLETKREIALPGSANDLNVNNGHVLVTFSHEKAERSFDVHDRERKGDFPPPSPKSGAAIVDVDAGTFKTQFVNQHLGFAVTGAISADGRTVVTGGWDRRLLVFDAQTGALMTERSFSWVVRRVRCSENGALVGVAAWTPVNALNEGDSEPSMVLYPVALQSPSVITP
jgi:WD40 repeat protein